MIQKICVLFWKDLVIRKNHYIASIFEVILPVVLVVLVNLSVPKNEKVVDNNPISFEAYKDKECFPRHSHYGSIIYEPSTPFTDILMTKAACYAGYKKANVKPGLLSNNKTYFSIGVKFENVNGSSVPSTLNYTLFPTNKALTKLCYLWRYYGSPIPKFSIPTLYSIVELQRGIDTSYLYMKNIPSSKIILENTDVVDNTQKVFHSAIFLTLIVAFSLMVAQIVGGVVWEKHTGAKELMLMMGVKRWQLWVAKFLNVILFISITVSGMIVFLCVPLKDNSNYFRMSPMILWSVIMYGLIGVVLFLFFITSFFDKPSLAVYITEVIWCFSVILNTFLPEFVQLPLFLRYLMFFFPHVSLMEGVALLFHFDFYEKEIKLMEVVSGREDSLPLLNILLMMTVNILLYCTLTWYMEQVNPGKFGVPQPYNFFCKKSYWVPRKVLTDSNNRTRSTSQENFEPVSEFLKPGICISNVTKTHKSKNKQIVTAVDDVSLNFHYTEITGLLGHNGAGKTTMFSMITGLTYPTSGKIMINGFNMSINICEARRYLGFCPQQDMLFNDLSTLETLKFYGVVKGLSLKEAKRQAMDLIAKLKLTDVINTQACNLSGGQKRKVSLGIALLGEIDVLVLDEPTAGMDPEMRREIWEMLLNLRSSRLILLITHFMDEADAVCDRIAIMDHGKIKCYGSPLFLKSRYGKGYVLTVVVTHLEKSKEIIHHIQQTIPYAVFKSQNVRNLYFELPESTVLESPDQLSALEDLQTEGQIMSYCMGLSTLEDVFLRLRSAHGEKDEFDIVDSPAYQKLEIDEGLDAQKTPVSLLLAYQFYALMLKKWIFFQNSFKSFLMYSLFPIILIWIMLLSSGDKIYTKVTGKASLTYSLDVYPSSLVLYKLSSSATFERKLFENLVESSESKAVEVNDTKTAINDIFNEDFYTYAKKVVLAVDNSGQDMRIYHNENAVHMVPIALNLVHNYLLKYWHKDETIVTSIDVRYTDKDSFVRLRPDRKCQVKELPYFSGTQTMFYLLVPLKECLFGAKGIQLMITPVPLYWFSHLLFDVSSFMVYWLVLFLGAGAIESDEILLKPPGEILLGFLFWGSGLIILAYIISTITKDVAAGVSVNIIIYVVFTFIVSNLIEWDGLPNFFQYFHPNCMLKIGIDDYCAGKQSNFVRNLFIYSFVLFIFLVMKDSKYFGRLIHSWNNRFVSVNYSVEEEKDEFVKEEEEVVNKLVNERNFIGHALIVSNLKCWIQKGFRPFPVVRGISFAVNRGECFGLLGVNGAGKTTTFRILTGEISASHGNSYAGSRKLSIFNRQYLFSIGYCPQFGGLIPVFKGKELLEFFARLRGIHGPQVKIEVQNWLKKMNLTEYGDKACGTYSGGNQRKLSAAIAMIGDQPLIFLDEPTSGVDPLSRRSIWNVIGETQKEGKAVVLTSHSMDECEALCSRLAIMVNGRFRCIGETTTLKDRFRRGYSIRMKLSNTVTAEQKNELAFAVKSDYRLVYDNYTTLQYHLTNTSISLPELFTRLRQLKERFSFIESYTASSTTLEDIFIYFARNNNEAE